MIKRDDIWLKLFFKTGIITFGPGAALRHTFKDAQNKARVEKVVDNSFKSIANKWGTRIDKGEKLALNQLFTTWGGDRSDASKVMMIFTDGKPTGHNEKDFTPLKQLTDRLEVRPLSWRYHSWLV